jgi:hypothetical protein
MSRYLNKMILLGKRGTIALVGAVMLLATVTQPAQAASPGDLAYQLQKTVAGVKFGEVLDTEPPASAKKFSDVDPEKRLARPEQAPKLKSAVAAAATQIHQQPNVDTTVIELDENGRPVSSGTVLTSPQNPNGVVVPVDANLHTAAVRYRHWDTNLWDTNNGQGNSDIVPGRENAPIDFMSPYPASILKLMVGFGILQLVDKGTIKLDRQAADASERRLRHGVDHSGRQAGHQRRTERVVAGVLPAGAR